MEVEGILLKPTTDVGGTDWTEEALRDATDTLVGSPVVESFGPDPDTIGKVTEAEYRDDGGVWYRAKIDDRIDISEQALAPALTVGAPVMDDDQDRIEVQGVEFESVAPVEDATEAVGEHEIIDGGDDDGSE